MAPGFGILFIRFDINFLDIMLENLIAAGSRGEMN